ncbi:MAG: CehA/McbA family metallohydrolase [Oscillospiraceae bacterium]|nr:CehA/McbA family metallohydrolase [Oscillospiraceae bacterium]MCL2278063.1 CehA/McbA family metallohydrolase [Oscillospiraceae bacterium]
MQDKKIIIDRFISKDEEDTYFAIPFTVPEGLERVTASYSYKKMLSGRKKDTVRAGIVDIGLEDAQGRFLGWSGSSKDSVFVGPYASTKGYLMTDITPGEWKIIGGAHRIPDEGLPVRYEITFTPAASRWLQGDLHIHSDASDGQHDIATLAKKALKKGLDFIAIANHNNYTDNLNPPTIPGLTIIPAVEWTHYRGHMNFFGVAKPFDNGFIVNNDAEMQSLIERAKEKGAIISVNHPKDEYFSYKWENKSCFDLVEIWNAPMRQSNMNAIAWWHEFLLSGRKLPIVGGSDYHRDLHPALLAVPVTKVYAKSPSSADILKAITAGHSYVTSSVKGAELTLGCGEAMMGDTVKHSGEVQHLSISAQKLRRAMRLDLITSDGVAEKWKKFSEGKLNEKVPIKQSWRFAYLVAVRRIFGKDYAWTITNPIYFE